MEIKTVKVKPWDPEQGDHVVINEADFDPKVHELLEPKKPEKKEPAAAAPAPTGKTEPAADAGAGAAASVPAKTTRKAKAAK
jgi:hypothetical protein